jgi:hypothetical protein
MSRLSAYTFTSRRTSSSIDRVVLIHHDASSVRAMSNGKREHHFGRRDATSRHPVLRGQMRRQANASGKCVDMIPIAAI